MAHAPSTDTAPRIASLDALRGFTVLFMLFVNDAASVRDLPWWLYHMPHGINGLTPVDVVFPAFLFMVGAAIPLAIDRRRAAGASRPELAWHAVTRGLALVLMGIFVMNGRTLDPAISGVPYGVWNGLALSSLVLAWWSDPKGDAGRQRVIRIVRVTAAVLLVVLAVVFRSKTPAEHHGWLDFRDWSILGIIGWSYLYAVLTYLWTRGNRRALFAALAAFVAWNAAARLDVVPVSWLAAEFSTFGRAGALSTVVAGIVAAKLLLAEGSAGRRLGMLVAYVLGLTVAAVALLQFGVSKDGATPSYELFCSAITTVLLVAFYYAIDVRGAWSGRPFLSAGRNALVVYLIPDIFYAIFGVMWLGPFGAGWIGALGSAVFAAAWVGIGALLTRFRVRMQL